MSYFRKTPDRKKLEIMMKYVDDVDYKVYDSHLIAKIKEFLEIREFKSIYNSQFVRKKMSYYIDLNDKNLIEISTNPGIGPFRGMKFLRGFRERIRRIYPIYIEDRDIIFQLNILARRLSPQDKKATLESLKLILNDSPYLEKILNKLEDLMKDYAEKLEFENANMVKQVYNDFSYIKEILQDKKDFVDRDYIFQEDGQLLLIHKGCLVYYEKDEGLEKFRENIKRLPDLKSLDKIPCSDEIVSLVYTHTKDRSVKIYEY